MVALDADKNPISQEPKGPVWDPANWNQKYVPGKDKWEHYFVGALIAFFTYIVIEGQLAKMKLSWQAKVFIGVMAAVWVAFLAMYGKEVWDSLGNGMADVWDMACGVLGALTVGVAAILVYAWFRARAAP